LITTSADLTGRGATSRPARGKSSESGGSANALHELPVDDHPARDVIGEEEHLGLPRAGSQRDRDHAVALPAGEVALVAARSMHG